MRLQELIDARDAFVVKYKLEPDMWGGLDSSNLTSLQNSANSLSGDSIASMTTHVSELISAIKNGEEISEEDLTNLQEMVTFLNNLELIGAGENVQASIAQGMTEAGWDTDAASVATNLQTALDTAMGTGMEETGEQTAAGIRNGRTDMTVYEDTGICMQRLNKQVIAPDILPRVLE